MTTMTRAEFDHICKHCMTIWKGGKRGALHDFEEFQSRVLLAIVETPGRGLSAICYDVLKEMRLLLKREIETLSVLEFDQSRPMYGLVVATDFHVAEPRPKHGGPRDNAGGPRANAGGPRPNSGGPRRGAGRKKAA